MDTKQFLQMIAGPGGTIHVRTQSALTKRVEEYWLQPDKYTAESLQEQFAGKSQNEQQNMWFQVSTVETGHKTPVMSNVIWADIDVYKYPGGMDQARQLLKALPKPTVIVNSGRGLHIYWQLEEAISAAGPMSPAQIIAKSAQWVLGADAAHAPTKLLRLPGTFNFKPGEYEGGLPCEIIEHNDVIYKASDFPVDEILSRVGHKLMTKIILGPTEITDRSEYDFHCVAELFKNGFSQEEIKHLMRNYPFSGKIKEGVPSVDNYIDRTIKSALFRVEISGLNTKKPKREAVSWVGKTLSEILVEEKPDFIVQDFLPANEVAMLAAPPKARKSWAVMQLAYSVATGQDWLGFTVPTPKRVLYVQAELPNWIVAERMQQMYGLTALENVKFFHIPGANLLDDEDLQGLLDAVTGFNADLVIIDPVANFWQGDENSSSSVNQLFDQIARIQAVGAAVVMVHHSRKTEANERLSPQHQRGSNVFFARPAAVMTLSPTLIPGEVPYTWADFSLRAAAPKDAVKLFTDSTGKFTVDPPALSSSSPVRSKLLAMLAEKNKGADTSESSVVMYRG